MQSQLKLTYRNFEDFGSTLSLKYVHIVTVNREGERDRAINICWWLSTWWDRSCYACRPSYVNKSTLVIIINQSLTLNWWAWLQLSRIHGLLHNMYVQMRTHFLLITLKNARTCCCPCLILFFMLLNVGERLIAYFSGSAN